MKDLDLNDIEFSKKYGVIRQTYDELYEELKYNTLPEHLLLFFGLLKNGFHPLINLSLRKQRYTFWKILNIVYEKIYRTEIKFPNRRDYLSAGSTWCKSTRPLFMIDGTHVQTHRSASGKPKALWRSYKFKHRFAGSFQVVFCAKLNKVISVQGPWPGSTADITAFRESGIYFLLERFNQKGKIIKINSDAGYTGESRYINAVRKKFNKNTHSFYNKVHNYNISSRRWRIEALFRRAKTFSMLNKIIPTYNKSKMCKLFRVVMAIINRDIQHRPLSKKEKFAL